MVLSLILQVQLHLLLKMVNHLLQMKLLLVLSSGATATLGTFTAGSKDITNRFTLRYWTKR